MAPPNLISTFFLSPGKFKYSNSTELLLVSSKPCQFVILPSMLCNLQYRTHKRNRQRKGYVALMTENEERKRNFDVENYGEHPLRRSRIKWKILFRHPCGRSCGGWR